MAWDDAKKEQVIAAYKAAYPTPETSTEIIKDIAEELEESPNGIRMILVQANVYVKKDSTSGSKAGSTKEGATPRVSKESQINALRAVLTDNGADVDEEILEKLTGKAAGYFTTAINQVLKNK